jgi:hypothetical protein
LGVNILGGRNGVAKQLMAYEGSCHCGAIRFRFKGEPITGAMRCNCSICRRKNALMSPAYYPPADFELLSGTGDLTAYRFEPSMVNHYFCRHCGIYPFHDAVEDPDLGYRVNLGCVDAIEDPHSLPVRVFDGADTFRYVSS